MKIGGMDAPNIAYDRIQAQERITVENNPGLSLNYKRAGQITEAEKRELPISEKTVIEAIEKANKVFEGVYRRFEFSVHEKTKEIMVKVIDSATDEVIREIPPEKILDLVATIWEMVGIIVDERR
ncbi:MAG TPA: flagellar protein FlaG [Clostridiaceae bacterium]|nr:flagellar protein FlaG [Clostridiaceae bacterium]